MQEKNSCENEPNTLKVSAKNIHWMQIFQWQCMHWYISYSQKNLKEKPNPKEFLLWNKRKSKSKSKKNSIMK
jgi:hypothetical protein